MRASAFAMASPVPSCSSILDLGMPDMDGSEVCARIRDWSDVPIIVLTVDDSERRKVETLDISADDYVTEAVLDPRVARSTPCRLAQAPDGRRRTV